MKLSGTVTPGGDVFDFLSTPDGTRTLYVADHEAQGIGELYSAVSDGSTDPVNLSRAQGANVPVALSRFSPPTALVASDSEHCVFIAERAMRDRFGLFSLPVDGSRAPIEITASLPAGGSLPEGFYGEVFEITPDATRVVFLFGEEEAELYSAPLDGSGPPVRLSEEASATEVVTGFRVSPDSQFVAFIFGPNSYATDGDLYRAPIDGAQPAVHLQGASGIGFRTTFQITPDSQRVLFASRALAETHVEELFSLLSDGTEKPQRIGGSVQSLAGQPLHISPDSQRVVFLSDHESGFQHELFSSPVDGSGSLVKLSPALSSGGYVSLPFMNTGIFGLESQGDVFSPDSSRVLFSARPDDKGAFALYSSDPDGFEPAVVLTPDGFQAIGPRFLPGSGRVAFLAGGSPDYKFELYTSPANGSAPAVRINPPPVPGGRLSGFSLDGTGTRALYIADQDVKDRFELFSISVGN